RRDPALAAAGEGHHAEGAELVAAALDRDVAGDAVASLLARIGRELGERSVEALIDLFFVERDVDGPATGERLAGEARDVAVAVGTGDQADVRRPGLELVAQVLGHAPGDADDQLGVVGAVAEQLGGPTVDAILGLLPDGAGVHEDQIGV